LNGATVQFSGVFERSNPFAGILSQMGAVSNKSIYRVKVEGQVRGNVILGHVKRTYEGETRSLAAANGDVKTIMGF
jgi:hypothetical protein